VNVADSLRISSETAQTRLRVAVVTETYPPEINGVAMTMGRLVEGLLAQSHRIQLLRPKQSRDDQPLDAHALQTKLLRGFPIPGYPGLRIGTPATGHLIRHWQGDRPDIVHIVTEGPLGWSALRATARLGIPTCADFHTNFHSYSAHYGFGVLKQAVANYLKRFHNRALCTMVPTEEMRADLAASGYRRLRVVARGVETKLFNSAHRNLALRQSWGMGKEHPAVIHVGRLAAEKNLSLVFTAFEAMRARHPRARLVLVGDGPKREHYQRQYPEHVFAGMRRDEDLATHYASGDIFLMPSLTETYGNVTVEAMASGLAVVAFDYAAARQHIQDGVNGLLVPPGNNRAFIEQACALIDDPALTTELGRAARRTAEGLAWDGVINALVTTYREVIAQHAQDAMTPQKAGRRG
jgi:glycosyltransferase involved in cell wall biosynthesis